MACRPAVRLPDAPPARPAGGRRALLLDRDGVVNADRGYVARVEDFDWVEGIFELCAAAGAAGDAVVVVTNQAGIGRGYYSEADFERLTRWMLRELRARAGVEASVYWCPHHPSAGRGEYLRDCPSRKPGAGMILAARDDLGLDLDASALVGDKASDLEAGRAAAVGRLLWLALAGAGTPPPGAVTVASLREARERLYGRGAAR